MLETLLGWSVGWKANSNPSAEVDLDCFRLYVIAVSNQKMNTRMTNKHFSKPYYDCLVSQTTFARTKLPSVIPKAGDRKLDKLFLEVIPDLAISATTKIPNLQRAANLPQSTEIYNESTYMEFHLLLIELLSKFRTSLEGLKALQCGIKSGERDLGVILRALRNVLACGHYLRMMVSGSTIETHLQTIADFLVVDPGKSWTPEPASEDLDDADVVDFQRLKPYSMRKGKPLSPWESYRDWLKLMVHYFDATEVLVTHVGTWNQQPETSDALSITILSPPLPDTKIMLPWTELLESDRFFPALPGESSGKDFVKFLTDCSNANNLRVKDIITVIEFLKQVPESGPLAPPDSLAAFSQLVKRSTPLNHDVIEEIFGKISPATSKDSRPLDLRTVVDLLSNLLKRANFYTSLKQGPLHCGSGFTGKYHCEAYIASLLALLYSEQKPEIKALLEKIKASHIFMHRLSLY